MIKHYDLSSFLFLTKLLNFHQTLVSLLLAELLSIYNEIVISKRTRRSAFIELNGSMEP